MKPGPRDTMGQISRMKAGEVLGTLTFGPILEAAALEMAALARDYNPLCLFPDDLPRDGSARPLLHGLWLTGLADVAIRRLIPGGVVVDLAMEHERPAQMGEALSFTATVITLQAGGEEAGREARPSEANNEAIPFPRRFEIASLRSQGGMKVGLSFQINGPKGRVISRGTAITTLP